MIKAIIFDLGGVYFSPGTEIAYEKLVKEFPHINSEKVRLIMRGGKLSRGYKSGKYSKKEFWKKAKELAGLNFDDKKFSKIWNSSYTLNTDVKNIVIKLRKNYKIAVLSGNIRERIRFLNKKHGFKKNFDVIVFSYMVGASKPKLKIYNEVLKRLKSKADECIFIDNSRKMLKPAEKLGMRTLLFKNAKQLRKELCFFGIKI
ncbi:HAD family phosphatase [Candidatus Woesearchaeota archaeon]|nr:HAD family phosphatase [Candidatus Woesearchaeota archaeon]